MLHKGDIFAFLRTLVKEKPALDAVKLYVIY
jgi:hypothetical protein